MSAYAAARRTCTSLHGSLSTSSERYAVRSSGASRTVVPETRFHWSIWSWEMRKLPSISPERIARSRVGSDVNEAQHDVLHSGTCAPVAVEAGRLDPVVRTNLVKRYGPVHIVSVPGAPTFLPFFCQKAFSRMYVTAGE